LLETPELVQLRDNGEACECGSGSSKFECCETKDPNFDVRQWLFPALTVLAKTANHLDLLVPAPLIGKQRDDILAREKHERALFWQNTALADDMDVVRQHILAGRHEEVSGKCRVLKHLLEQWRKEGSKVLLFSYSTQTLSILESFLSRSFNLIRLDGTTPIPQRQKLVDRFNRDESVFLFLISTKAGGLGLNLATANRVVVFDPNWNVTLDLQAQDRAYRFGQTRYTKVYRMISAGTIEEITYNRQVYKQQLANIGLKGKHERRYFTGVQGMKNQQGELFGLGNLFKPSLQTKEIIDRARKAEEAQTLVIDSLDPTAAPDPDPAPDPAPEQEAACEEENDYQIATSKLVWFLTSSDFFTIY
jgi:hypothetical protein